MNVVEKEVMKELMITKEDYEKYFYKRKDITKEEYEKYLKRKFETLTLILDIDII